MNSLAIESLARTGRLKMRASGASMLPSLWPGDELRIEACTLPALKRGDVVLFRRAERLFVHRVVGLLGDDTLITRGDALAHNDLPVRACDVLGRLAGIERAGRVRKLAPPGMVSRLGRSLIRHSDFATRLALRWHRASAPAGA